MKSHNEKMLRKSLVTNDIRGGAFSYLPGHYFDRYSDHYFDRNFDNYFDRYSDHHLSMNLIVRLGHMPDEHTSCEALC